MRHALLALASLAALSAPAVAAAPLLEAQTVTASAERVVVRGAVFTCDGDTCRTRSSASRPMTLCQRLVKETGPLARFSVDGVAMGAEELAACNAKAK